MTEKSLQSLLEKLNSGKTKSMLIFTRPLNQYVDFAEIWMQKPKISNNVTISDGPDHFYLLKDDEGIFIAVVYDMLRDLHWYVLPGYHKQGYLTKSMKTAIIPHLFLERDQQKITID